MDQKEADTLIVRILTQSEGYGELGMWDYAWEVIQELPLELRNDPAVLQVSVNLLISTDQKEKALILANRLASTFPERADSWFCLGFAQCAVGNTEETRAALTKCIEIDPEFRRRIVETPVLMDIF